MSEPELPSHSLRFGYMIWWGYEYQAGVREPGVACMNVVIRGGHRKRVSGLGCFRSEKGVTLQLSSAIPIEDGSVAVAFSWLIILKFRRESSVATEIARERDEGGEGIVTDTEKEME